MYDVVIVGAGTSGAYTAYRLAKAGLKTAIIEMKPREKIGEKVCGDAIGEHYFETLEIDPPKLGVDAEGIFEGVKVYSPSKKYFLTVRGKGYALNRKNFGQRLLKMALDSGAELYDKHTVVAPLIKENAVKGVKARELGKGVREFNAKVVIDASGSGAVVRTKLPREWWVSYKVPKEDIVMAYREIVEVTENPDEKYAIIYLDTELAPGGYWWWFPKSPNIANIGIGVQIKPGNPNPRIQYEKRIRPIIGKRYVKTLHAGGGLVPTRRMIPCMVWNGFIAIGDAACTANPIHGGGIGSSLLSGLAAIQTILEATEKGDYSIRGLWKHHHRYIEFYGAKQASLDVLRYLLQKFSNDDLEYVFEKSIISGDELYDMGTYGRLTSKVVSRARVALKLLSRPSMLKMLKDTKDLMDEAKELYRKYPENPDDYPAWREREKELFKRVRERFL